MAFTTNIYDEMDRRNLKLAAADAARRTPGGGGGLHDIPASPTVASPTEGRSFGFRSGAAPVGGVAAMHLKEAAEAGKELGEPTSFRGGEGAPAPIGVIRGMRQTFATDVGEPQLKEFATGTQAGQAWHKGQRGQEVAEGERRRFTIPETTLEARHGKFIPTGATLKGVAPGEEPGAAAYRFGQGALAQAQARITEKALAKTEAGKGGEDFQKWLNESPYSTYDPKTGEMGFVAKDEGMAQDVRVAMNLAQTQGGEVGRKHFEERQSARKWLQTQALPAEFDAHSYLTEVSKNPEAWAELMKKAGTLKVSPGLTRSRSSDWLRGPVEAVGGVGGKLKHELTPPGTLGETVLGPRRKKWPPY